MNLNRASLAYENIVRFSQDFDETILVGKFMSREIGEKCASRCSRISNTAEQLTTILHAVILTTNIIAKLNAMLHQQRPLRQAYPARRHA